jgi:hypothetical protein
MSEPARDSNILDIKVLPKKIDVKVLGSSRVEVDDFPVGNVVARIESGNAEQLARVVGAYTTLCEHMGPGEANFALVLQAMITSGTGTQASPGSPKNYETVVRLVHAPNHISDRAYGGNIDPHLADVIQQMGQLLSR